MTARKDLLDGATSGKYVEHPLPPIVLNHDAIMVDGDVHCISRYRSLCCEGDKVMFQDGTKGTIISANGSAIVIRSKRQLDPDTLQADSIIANYTHHKDAKP